MVLVIALLFGITSSQQKPDIHAKTIRDSGPYWVQERPHAEGYFTGIGVAKLGNDLAESRDKALKNALNDIATQIGVTLSSEIEQKDTEKNGQVRSEYQAAVKTLVSSHLEGVEIAETWQDAVNYWVYARLSIEEFERLRQSKIENARRMAFDLYIKGVAMEPLAISASLSNYLHIYKPLSEALCDPLRIMSGGKSIDLDVEVPAKIKSILSAITLDATPVTVPIKQGTEVNIPLKVIAKFVDANGNKLPIKGLPLAFRVDNGQGHLSSAVWTEDNGMAISTLEKIQQGNTITASVDLIAFWGQDTTSQVLAPQLSAFIPPTTTFHLNVSRRTACVISSERNIGNPLSIPYLEPIAKKSLEEIGVVCTERCDQADLVLEINGQTRPGNQLQNIHFSFLDMTISIRDRVSGHEIFKSSLNNTKGAGATFEHAGIKAYETATTLFISRLWPEALEALNK